MTPAHRITALSLLFAIATLSQVSAQMRPDVGGPEAAVVSDHPLASAAGAEVLRRGGNAMDAAITMAGVLAVVRPHMNGLGGDNFLLYRDAKTGKVYALNGSGPAGSVATPAHVRAQGHERMPQSGVISATVPGVVRAWAEALQRYGTIPLARALEPAIGYAERGFPVSTQLHEDIDAERTRIAPDAAMAAVFLPNGAAPKPGSVLKQPDLAGSLRALAARGPDELYTGATGRRIAEFVERERGLFNAQDLAAYRPLWQDPISTTYHGARVFAFPPNSQGLALLMQLNMAEAFDLKSMGHNSVEYLHTLVELKKLAFADRDAHITDPAAHKAPVDRLLSREYARERIRSLTARATSSSSEPHDDSGDTVFLCVVDREGNMVSMIQSLYSAFGSKRMVPGTGIVLHNRGGLFSLDPAHVNVIAPNKRTYHTLAPSLVLREDGSPLMTIGTPGGDGQTMTLLQVLNNMLLFGMMSQQAVEAARYRSFENGRLLLDAGIPEAVRTSLGQRGHDVRLQSTLSSEMGGAQVIWIHQGMRITGADPRREAYGIAY
jgi:gamma-glutamyltranspeptidase / glutathione hydrolase